MFHVLSVRYLPCTCELRTFINQHQTRSVVNKSSKKLSLYVLIVQNQNVVVSFILRKSNEAPTIVKITSTLC